MINAKEVLQTLNTIIKSNSGRFYNAITVQGQKKPDFLRFHYPIVCSFNLTECKQFYENISNDSLTEIQCPLGFTVCKKTFNTATNYKAISIFSIIDFNNSNSAEKLLSNIPRNFKPKRNEALEQLRNISFDLEIHRKNKEYIESLVETLLIGRIGLAIQTISHQFFTPLQGAMSDVRNLELNRDLKDSLNRLIINFSALNRLATEIQLLLSTSQEFNTNMLRKVTVHKMVNDIFESLSAFAHEKKLKLINGKNYHAQTIEAIPGQLSIVLNNLIQNAVKYSYNGTSEIPLSIRVDYNISDNNELVIEVKNQGCRITEEEIKERLIFNLGYRGEYSTDRQRQGSGSGLYISEQIVKSHKGRIEVSSNFCGGIHIHNTDRYENTFWVYWPVYYE